MRAYVMRNLLILKRTVDFPVIKSKNFQSKQSDFWNSNNFELILLKIAA